MNPLRAYRAYERTPERLGYANGYKPKRIDTPARTVTIQVPKTAGHADNPFYPQSLERGQRSSRAVMLAVAEMYITLSWHPDEAAALSRSEMLRAADETIRVLGAEDRQALIVCHTDRPHPHVHVILNRVSPEDGRMLTTGIHPRHSCSRT